MCPNIIGCSAVPRTRKFASASRCAPGHSIWESGNDVASTSNCKFRIKLELLGPPELELEANAPIDSKPSVNATRCTCTFPDSKPPFDVPESRNCAPNNQLMPSG